MITIKGVISSVTIFKRVIFIQLSIDLKEIPEILVIMSFCPFLK